ncbi:MAG: alpha/beta hydrolase [Sporocytophaga sp.]|uniref:alpha/beta hydrolase n=1 Tax=Sporocytophaga sp. TaxID=2231183 RepID=UPI001B178C7F|nr:alpha/beta hydrolase [Sporocytophaga sp.]MBO9699176.1 alpha/beta hydrolase [Sporocytophaga sp.]
MKTHFLKVEKTARYCTLGEMNEQTKSIWIVCHGYGQLAPYFIDKFKILDDGKTLIVAPEALSRFYLEGFSGRVGATWMTKEEREKDIEDYVEYIEKLYNEIIQGYSSHQLKLNILGFSQGVATVCRWVVSKKKNFDKLILWAGIFPPDLNTDFQFSMETFQEKDIYIVYGDKDPLLKEDHLKELELLGSKFKNLKVLTFNGKHEINQEVLIFLKQNN